MTLRDWLIQRYNLTLDTTGDISGEALVTALCRMLAAAGFDFDSQKSVLLEAPSIYCDTDFLEACINQVNRIERLQSERCAALERHLARCHNGGGKRRARIPAAEAAVYRFAPTWPLTNESADIVEDMLTLMADAGYIEPSADALRDLRQGFGYYRPGEDSGRLRRPVRWLGKQNALHYWICALLGDHDTLPLITVTEGGAGRWVTAASIFLDRRGNAFTYDQLEHGNPSDSRQREWLDSTVPLRPISVHY